MGIAQARNRYSRAWLVPGLLLAGLWACGGGGAGDGAPADPVPVIESFTATPSAIPAGGSTQLAWGVTGATSLSLDNGLGAVTGTSLAVSPLGTTTYRLTASNAAGSVSKFTVVTVTGVPLGGTQAYGVVPNGLPGRLAVGLVSDPGDTWMPASGAAWDLRYHYFTKGWRDNWTWDPTNSGQWGLGYMNECDAQGYVPAIQYYCMNGYSNYDESAFYATTGNAATMAAYFDDFKVLMQRCKDFGKPVLVLLEGDGYAYMAIQSGNNPNAYSAVAATGLSELQGLPNTAAGWGLAFLQLRKAVGATNVVLGMHISAWATSKDISYYSVTDPLQPEVDKAYAFLSKLGLAANGTGETYDLLVGDPLDRDSDFYRLTQGVDRWWDASDNASIATKSFNRYAEWLRLWNQTARKRWVLWQIPLGNGNHLNVNNTGQARGGYRDNRPEYFFGSNGDAHRRRFADAGVIALLFGAGAAYQSSYQNDTYSDGQLFLQSRAGAFLNGGGLPITTVSR
jgi:hypothetical protein